MWNVQSSRKISLLLTFKSNYCSKSIKVCMWTFKPMNFWRNIVWSVESKLEIINDVVYGEKREKSF